MLHIGAAFKFFLHVLSEEQDVSLIGGNSLFNDIDIQEEGRWYFRYMVYLPDFCKQSSKSSRCKYWIPGPFTPGIVTPLNIEPSMFIDWLESELSGLDLYICDLSSSIEEEIHVGIGSSFYIRFVFNKQTFNDVTSEHIKISSFLDENPGIRELCKELLKTSKVPFELIYNSLKKIALK